MLNLVDLDGDPLARHEGNSPATPEVPSSGQPLRILRSIKRHPWIALLVLVLVSTAGIAAVGRKIKPSYRAEAILYIDPMPPRVLYTDEEWHNSATVGFYEDYQRTLTHFAKMPDVLDAAIEALNKEGVDWVHPGVAESEIRNHLRARIDVSMVRDTHLLKVGTQDVDPDRLEPIVRTVTDALLKRLMLDAQTKREKTLKALRADRQRLATDLENCQTQLDGLTERVGVPVMDEKYNIFYERLNKLSEGMTKLFLRRTQADGELQKALARAKELRTPVSSGEVEAALALDSAVRAAQIQSDSYEVEFERAVQPLRKDGDLYLERKAILDAGKVKTTAIIESARKRIADRMNQARRSEADDLVARAKRESKAALESERLMQEVLASARGELTDYEQARTEGNKLRRIGFEIVDAISRIDRRIEQLRVESGAGLRVRLRSPAVKPLKPLKDMRMPFKAAAIVFALLAALIAALVFDRIRPRIVDSVDVDDSKLELVHAFPGGLDSQAGAEAFVAIRSMLPRDMLRVLICPADGRSDLVVSERLTDVVSEAARGAGSTLTLHLLGNKQGDGPVTNDDGHTTWGPLGELHTLAERVSEASFATEMQLGLERHDYAIASAPSPLDSGAGLELTRLGFAVVLVSRSGKSNTKTLQRTRDLIERSGGRILGVVLAR